MERTSSSERGAARLQQLLGLTDEELIRTLDASALELLAGELDHRPELCSSTEPPVCFHAPVALVVAGACPFRAAAG